MTEITELLERVKAATGPDRELDALILLHLNGWTLHEETNPKSGSFAFWEGEPWNSVCHNCSGWEALTASIDAALALVERCLPGWVVSDLCQNSRHAGDPWGCELSVYYGSDPSKNRSAFSGYDFPSAPLAILGALLTALIAQAEP